MGRGRAQPHAGHEQLGPTSFNPLGGGAGSGYSCLASVASARLPVSIPSEVGRGRAPPIISVPHADAARGSFQSPRRRGGVGLSGRCNDWPDMSLGSGFPYPPENGTKLGSLSLAPGSPGKRKRREQNRLRQVVTGARNRVNQGYETRQSKKRRARPPRSVTGTRPGARRKPETRRGPVHSPRNGASKAGGVREPRR